MKTFTGKLNTSKLLYLNVFDVILIKLVGEDGESDQTWLSGVRHLLSGGESTFTLNCPDSIGKILMVELDKWQLPLVPKRSTFVDKIVVTGPDKCEYTFPIYHWIKEGKVYRFREGRAIRAFDEQHPLCKDHREMELKARQLEYKWKTYRDGFPHCMDADDVSSLPNEVQFSFTKDIQFKFTAVQGLIEMNLNGLANCKESWENVDAIAKALSSHKSSASEYVQKHWKEDAFFGYQYLNGLNPILIRRCTSLPSNFPVTDGMVSLEGGASLANEMKGGNIFLCDYKLLEDVKMCRINEKKQYLAAPLVLLHKTPDDELKPIAIQLQQTPSEDNPIFVPADSEYDWLLAKTFVRGAEFFQHELNVHLLRTHLLAEVFTVALMRNMPKVHPLYKLLKPHTRYNLQINVRARETLITRDDDSGLFNKFSASGGKGTVTVLQRSLSSVTYSSLCIPDDITERGVESVPNYYYRDDGLRLWDIIQQFVNDTIIHYYKSDKDVQDDTELQNYIKDIFEYGFLSNKESGIPQSFASVKELVKFLTMVVFTGSAQHAAVNHGQLNLGAFIPNFPITLARPPPTEKGNATEQTLLETLPIVNASMNSLAALWLLTKEFDDAVPLGQFPYERFIEDGPIDLMNTFEKNLKEFGDDINRRNSTLELPYIYMCPGKMENSVTI